MCGGIKTFQPSSIFAELSKMCVVMEDNVLSIDQFWLLFLNRSIALVVDITNQNKSFCLAAAAYNGWFSSNLIRRITFFGDNPSFAIVYDVSPRFDHIVNNVRRRSYCYPSLYYPLFVCYITYYQSLQK